MKIFKNSIINKFSEFKVWTPLNFDISDNIVFSKKNKINNFDIFVDKDEISSNYSYDWDEDIEELKKTKNIQKFTEKYLKNSDDYNIIGDIGFEKLFILWHKWPTQYKLQYLFYIDKQARYITTNFILVSILIIFLIWIFN